jgi:hypothetical protein
LNAAFSATHDQKISTVCKTTRDEGEQSGPIGQVSAFAAIPAVPTPSAKSGKGNAKSQRQGATWPDRGRPTERQKESGSEATRPRSRSPSQQSSTVNNYKTFIEFVAKNGALKFLQRLHQQCATLKEPLFVVDQKGSIVLPVKLTSTHSWGQFNGKLGIGSTLELDLFAGLMLARDMCGQGVRFSKTGSQHCSDNDATWTKEKAIELRGDLPIAGVSDSHKKKGKGKGKGKGAFASLLNGRGDEDDEESN